MDHLPEIAKTAEQLAPEVARVADTLGIPSALGDTVGPTVDKLRLRREERYAILVNETAKRLLAAGVAYHAVRDPFLRAVVEHATLEDNPDLQNKWAALLATAASDADAAPIALPNILAQLSPREARALDAMHHGPDEFDARHLADSTGLTQAEFDNLHRLGLIGFFVATTVGSLGTTPRTLGEEGLSAVHLTHLGQLLVRACSTGNEL